MAEHEAAVTSGENAKVKGFREGKKSGKFIFAEGFKIASEALSAGIRPEMIAATPEFLKNLYQADVFYKLKKNAKDSFVASDKIFRKFSEVEEPQGIAFLAEKPLPDIQKQLSAINANGIVVVLDNIGDPGNMGTIIRTCKAASVLAVITSAGSVSIYNPKVLRSTMGAVFGMNIIEGVELEACVKVLKEKKISIVTTDLKADMNFWDAPIKLPAALVFGNESRGISKNVLELTDLNVKLPINGDIDSLNVSVSAGIMIYDLVRRFKLF